MTTKTMINKYRLLLILLALLALLSFYVFSHEVRHGFLKQIDFNFTVKLQERIDTSSRLRFSAFIGNVFEGSTMSASPEISIVLLGLLTIAGLYDRNNRKVRIRMLLIPVLFGLLVMGEIYGKNVVHHPAPPYFMIKNPVTIFPKYYINEAYSYPSGHTARAVFLGLSFYYLFLIPNSLFKRKKMKFGVTVGLIGYIVMVGISRIYLGQHWLSDIIGGGLLGGGLGLLTAALISPIITSTMSDET
jgi:membrane-associated phospholipid phosphatase